MCSVRDGLLDNAAVMYDGRNQVTALGVNGNGTTWDDGVVRNCLICPKTEIGRHSPLLYIIYILFGCRSLDGELYIYD